jgi:hypothetical protein
MSLRKAINQMCKSCIHDPLSAGTWRQQIFLCSVKSCPLWELRAKPTRPIPLTIITQYRAENDEFQPKEGA